jgi:hypothetical protein
MKAVRKITVKTHNTWFPSIKKLHLIPSIVLTYNSSGSFIEHGVYEPLYLINLSWLSWELTLIIYWDLEDE